MVLLKVGFSDVYDSKLWRGIVCDIRKCIVGPSLAREKPEQVVVDLFLFMSFGQLPYDLRYFGIE